MNAPAANTDLAPTSAYKLIEIDSVVPSQTHIQQLRRARFDPATMAELVASVNAHGVLQPIVVRANIAGIEASEDATPWEIVAGERRWLAAQKAQLAHIPAIIRELSDLQVLEIQLVENLQREGMHPLEEAEGFAELMKLKNVNAQAIAETIGRSRSHVFCRLKLLDLIPAARDALNTGRIDASKALHIARIAVPKLQMKALKYAQSTDYQGEPLSFRDFKHKLNNDTFVVALKGANFRLNDASLLPAAGNCIECPKRTGNLGDLFSDVADPDVCTDPHCFNQKTAAEQDRRRNEAQASGRAIISGDEAQALVMGHGVPRGYIDLDTDSDEEFAEPEPALDEHGTKSPEWNAWDKRADEFQPRTYRQILGEAGTAAAVLLDHGKKLREIVPIPLARKLLKPHGITLPAWVDYQREPAASDADRQAEEEKQRERQECEEKFRHALLAQIHVKWKGPLKHDDLLAIAERLFDKTDTEALQIVCYANKPIEPAKLNDAELMRLLVELTVSENAQYLRTTPAPLLALAKRFKIDPTKVKKDLASFAKATKNPAPAPAKKEAPAPAKKKPVVKKPIAKKGSKK